MRKDGQNWHKNGKAYKDLKSMGERLTDRDTGEKIPADERSAGDCMTTTKPTTTATATTTTTTTPTTTPTNPTTASSTTHMRRATTDATIVSSGGVCSAPPTPRPGESTPRPQREIDLEQFHHLLHVAIICHPPNQNQSVA